MRARSFPFSGARGLGWRACHSACFKMASRVSSVSFSSFFSRTPFTISFFSCLFKGSSEPGRSKLNVFDIRNHCSFERPLSPLYTFTSLPSSGAALTCSLKPVRFLSLTCTPPSPVAPLDGDSFDGLSFFGEPARVTPLPFLCTPPPTVPTTLPQVPVVLFTPSCSPAAA